MWQELGCPATVSVGGGLSHPGEAPPGESPILLVRLVVEQILFISVEPVHVLVHCDHNLSPPDNYFYDDCSISSPRGL